jgi:outer membrane receptor protein involved in Fe transport
MKNDNRGATMTHMHGDFSPKQRSIAFGPQVGRQLLLRVAMPLIMCLSIWNIPATAQVQKRDPSALDEIVVTAQKREERLKDVPISISVLGGKVLDHSSFTSVNDALNTVPGVSLSPAVQGSGSLIQIRGAGAPSPTYGGPSTVAYYIDSVPFGLTRSALLPNPPSFDMQRVEVLRGPQGTLYGANAENGVVRVLTNDADLNSFGASARTLLSNTTYGGVNYGGDLAINVPIVEGKLAVRGVVDYQNLSGWVDSPIGSDNNTSNQRSYRLKVNAQPTEELFIGLSAWVVHNDFGAFNESTDQRTVEAIIPEPISTDWNSYALKIAYDFHNFTVTNTASLFKYRDENIFDLGKYPTGAPLGTPFFNQFRSKVFSNELLISSAPNVSWRWTAGMFYRDDTERGFATLPFLLRPIANTDNSKSFAVFGQVGRRFLKDQFEWTLGVRYFHDKVSTQNLQLEGFPPIPAGHAEASFSPVTPRAVLTWYPNKDITAYASYSEGVRSGLPQTTTVILIDPNFPPVKPDKLHNYEIGGKADLLNRLVSLDAALYYIKWKDVQQSIIVPFGSFPVGALINGPSASGMGIDLAATVRPLEGLELSVSGGWNDLKMDGEVLSAGALLFRKGDRLNYSPDLTGTIAGAYEFQLGGDYRGRFMTSYNYISTQKSYFVSGGIASFNTGDPSINLRTTFSVLFPAHWTATLFADNLTNNYGALPTYGYHTLTGQTDYRPRPRTIGLQVDFKY